MRRRSVAEAVQMPTGAIEVGAGRHVLAEVMQVARACELARDERRGEDEGAISSCRALTHDFGYVSAQNPL